MQKWSLVVTGLYGVALFALGFPLSFFAYLPKIPKLLDFTESILPDMPGWQVLLIIAVMMLAQFALLRVPVAASTGRPVPKRSIWTTAIASAFMMGLLVLGAVSSCYEFATNMADNKGFLLVIACGIGSWLFWTFYFYRALSRTQTSGQMSLVQRYLWTGSILELLVAIPTHIVVRNRGTCCAGIMTFIGLSCGFAVMVFAFGPALYFLFLHRWKSLQPRTTQ